MPGPILTQDFFRGRRERFFDAMGDDTVAVIPAGPATPNHVKFRQNSDFYYLTGFPEPGAVAALLKHDGEQKYVLFVPPRDEHSERWDGSRAGVEGAVDDSGADTAHSVAALEKEVPALFLDAWHAYLKPDVHTALGRTLFAMYERSAKSSDRLGHGAVELKDPTWLLASMRVHKAPEELDMMRHAASISRASYGEAIPHIKPGAYEYEIQARLEYGWRSRGADGPSYSSIVGGGNNSTCLHYVENDRVLHDGDVVLIDAGCMYGHYASDVTRTYPVNGTFSDPQRRIYEIVLRAEKATTEATKPGVSVKDLQRVGALVMIQGMVELGWLEDKDPEELFEGNAHRPYFMHGIAHHLGLDTHDSAPAESEGEPFQIQEGAVVTIEPGIYISEGAEGVDEEYHGIGVRVEDDVLVTADGHEVLTDGIAKEIDDIEAAVGSA